MRNFAENYIWLSGGDKTKEKLELEE